MGNCKFCGQKAGFLKSKHTNCQTTYFNGKIEISKKIIDSITSSGVYSSLDKAIDTIARNSFLPQNELPQLLANSFEKAVEHFLQDGLLTVDEEEKLAAFKNRYSLDQNMLDRNGSWQKVVKAAILRDIMEGKIPERRIAVNGNLPFILQKAEILIWLFQNVQYYEQQTKTIYQGASHGVSFKVAKGVYYRTGSFKGKPVKVNETKFLGTGVFAMTNCNIYFASAEKIVKIPYAKLIMVSPYEDGVGIQKDGTSAKPQMFKGLDGWFTYNLISNLVRL